METQITGNTSMCIEYYPGIGKSRPKFPNYALFSARLKSFSSWSSGKISNPETLSKAGLFFSGTDDLVKCFFCGGGLKDWQYEDIPWIEHARWFPGCKYVKLCKGEDFANNCRSANYTENIDKEMTNSQENIPDDWMVRKLNSHTAKELLSNGFCQEDVENGIMRVKQNHGKTCDITRHIFKYLLDLEKYPLSEYKNVHLPQETLVTSATRNITENIPSSLPSLHEDLPSPNLILRGSNYRLPEETRRLATDELRRVEREETELREENRKLRDIIVCKVCLDSQASIVFIPCGHFVSCYYCSTRLDTCAICRSQIERKVFAQ